MTIHNLCHMLKDLLILLLGGDEPPSHDVSCILSFRPGRLTRPGWMLLKPRSTRELGEEKTKQKEREQNPPFVPQLHLNPKPGVT